MRRALALVTILLIAGCDGAEKGQTVEVKTRAEVETVVRARADAVTTLAAGTLENFRMNGAPCDGPGGATAEDGRWNLSGFGAIVLPAEKHLAALQAIKKQWEADGWRIDEDRTLPDGVRGALSGAAPDGIGVTVTSSRPPKQLALIVVSRCYRPAPGEDPANQ